MPLPPASYLICATPRTGSTLLQDALYPLGIAGRPREYFGLTPEHWVEQLKNFDGDYVTRVLAAGRTPNGVFGAKVLYYQFVAMIGFFRAHTKDETTPPARLLRRVLPNLRYIWIRREDHLAQAVSEAMAVQSGVWQMRDGDTVEAKPVAFNYDQIHGKIELNKSYDREWQDYFEENAIEPLVIEYQDFVSRYRETLKEVLSFLQLPTDTKLPAPPLKKLANATSESWIQQFHETAKIRRVEAVQKFEQAVALHRQGRTGDATKHYIAVLALDAFHFDTLHNLGVIRLQTGHAEMAVRLITRAVQQNPASAEAHNNLAVALQAMNRHEDAFAAWRKAIALRPDYAEAHHNLGVALRALNRLDQAIAHFERVVALRPDHAEANAHLGAALRVIAEASAPRALTHLEKAVALKPEMAEAHHNLGLLLRLLRRTDEAELHLQKAAALSTAPAPPARRPAAADPRASQSSAG